ncbi:MAG: DUF433 domain-containing protein [Nitrospirae bacterium]|nr:DUF433 domain-containing protein [Nitrospirota bacterium]
MSTAARSSKLHPYVARQKGVCGGSPIVRGTRIRVIDIAIEYDRLGYSPDDIANGHPGLTLEQIHDALSYYYENQKELDAEIRERLKRIERVRSLYPSLLKISHGED